MDALVYSTIFFSVLILFLYHTDARRTVWVVEHVVCSNIFLLHQSL